MKRMNKLFVLVICALFAFSMFSGCKAKKAQESETNIKVETEAVTTEETECETEEETSALVDEGDVEIVIPDDQEQGGE